MENLIDKYVIGKLDGKALTNFREQLKMDENLRAEVRQRRKIVAGLEKVYWRNEIEVGSEKIIAEQLGQRFAKFEKMEKKGRVVLFVRRNWLAVAASVLILLSVGIWLTGSSTVSNEILFALHYEMPALKSLTMIAGTVRDTQEKEENDINLIYWKKMEAAYQQQDYKLALENILKIDLPTFQKYEGDYLSVLAVLLMKNEFYEKALPVFQNPKASNPKQNKWFAALIKLKLDYPKEELIAEFEAIFQSDITPNRKKQAREILENLRK